MYLLMTKKQFDSVLFFSYSNLWTKIRVQVFEEPDLPILVQLIIYYLFKGKNRLKESCITAVCSMDSSLLLPVFSLDRRFLK